MKYIINNTIQYDTEKSTLTVTEKYMDEIKLTVTQNKLLLYLVNNNGKSIPREKILNEIWGEDSRSANNTNLNNYISVLRKFFEYFEERELIITIRGEGFQFNTKSLELINSSQDTLVKLPRIDKNKKLNIVDALHKNLKVIYLSLLLLVLCVLMFFTSKNTDDNEYILKIEKFENCTFKFIKINGFENYNVMDALKIHNIIKKKGYECKKEATIFFYLNSTPVEAINNNDSKYFFAYCVSDINNRKRMTCENYYETIAYR